MAIVLHANVDCRECGVTFSAQFVAEGAEDREDIMEPPVALLSCPACECVQSVSYPGWAFWTEAG